MRGNTVADCRIQAATSSYLEEIENRLRTLTSTLEGQATRLHLKLDRVLGECPASPGKDPSARPGPPINGQIESMRVACEMLNEAIQLIESLENRIAVL
jgi:hypothetical protein